MMATAGRGPARRQLSLRRVTPWMLLAPALAILVFFVLIPYGGALLYAFTDATLTRTANPDFVGLRNFERIFAARLPPFSMILTTTLIFSLGTALGSLVLGSTMAIVLHTLAPGRRAVFMAILLIPYVLAGVIIGYAWKLIYDPQIGLANALLSSAGLGGISWLTERWLAIVSLVVANVWAASAIVLLVVSSALSNLPRNIVLAAQVDGAGTVTTLRRVVFPNIAPALLLATLVAVISGVNVFDLIFVMTGGGPVYQTETFALTMYRLTFKQGEVAQGAAFTGILFVLSFALAVAYLIAWQREARRWR